MKKLVNFAAVAVMAVASLFVTSCATTGAAGSEPASIHPREYTLDLSDSKTGSVIPVVFNQYGPNYQSEPAINFTANVKKDKPQAGDTVHVYYKFSVDRDIPALRIALIDPTVNYWLELAADECIIITDVKAGEVVEGNKDIVLEKGVSGEFKVYIAYDTEELLAEGYDKVDGPANFTFFDVEDVTSTDVALELPADPNEGLSKVVEVNVNKIAAYCGVVTGHPWINGVQNMNEIENYQADISFMECLSEELVEGDTVVVTWKAKANIDIPVLYCIVVDHSKEVGWWNVISDESTDEDKIIARDIKAGEPFEVNKTYVLTGSSVTTDVNLRVWYDYDAATNGPGPCEILAVRD